MKKIIKIETNQKEESTLRVAAYARVSTDDDAQLVSLKTQKAHYKKMIEENKSYAFAGLYFDEGITGTKKECRDGLLKMLDEDNFFYNRHVVFTGKLENTFFDVQCSCTICTFRLRKNSISSHTKNLLCEQDFVISLHYMN